MAIRLYDSLTRSLRELRRPDPANPRDVFTFYNCGPTVYGPAHIGNFRTFAVNDVLRRLLELEFGADKVKHVRNLTDVDDRTIGQAKKENRPLADITKHWTQIFHEDCRALNLLPPHAEPTATGYIKEQVNMIEVLMQKGCAYRAADGSVYFKISSFPEYGGLSRIKERELKVTNTTADADHKDSVSDFALWKAYKPDEDGAVQWPGPDGAAAGRPGWHIECSAMSKALLGDTIDLHTGGVDLLFPHHENEIAQSQCCNGTTFARHWYHSEHLLVDGTTMSKSKGNYYTVRDLLAKGHSPIVIRYALLLMGHPRHQLNFTLPSLDTALHELCMLKRARNWWLKLTHHRNEDVSQAAPAPSFTRVIEDLKDDLNTTAARSHLIAALGSQESASSNLRGLDLAMDILGIDLKSVQEPTDEFRLVKDEVRRFREKLERRETSMAAIDTELFQLGWKIEVSGETWHLVSLEQGPPKADAPAEIKALAEKRWAAKAAKDFASADALRKEIAAAGWSMLDRKDGYSLEPMKK